MRPYMVLACPIAIGLLFPSCGESLRDVADEVQRDGAGTLQLEMTLGDDGAGRAEYEFSNILSLIVTPDGTLWILDGNSTFGFDETPMLRRYDFDGRFLGQVGRVGSGPGEYRAPYALASTQDGRVAVRDFGPPGRITLYRADGTFDTVWSDPGRWPFSGGDAIQVDTAGLTWLPFREGRRGTTRAFLRVRSDGSVLDTVGFPRVPEVARDTGAPYQPYGRWTWSPFGHFAVVRTDEYRIVILPPPEQSPGDPAAAGTRQATEVTRDVEPIAVTKDEREAVRASLVGRSVEGVEIPLHKPPVRYISYSDDGRLLVWVSTPSRLQDGEWSEPDAIDMFGPGGRFLERVTLPDSFTMVRMRGDHIWGVYRDGHGVESVRRYAILRH